MIFFLDNFLISPLVLLIPRLGLRLTLLFLFHTFLFSLDSPLISLLCCLVTTMNEFGFFIRSELIGGSLPSLLPPFLRFVHFSGANLSSQSIYCKMVWFFFAFGSMLTQ